MNRTFKVILTLCLLFLISQPGFSQYFGEQVMEKSFEQADFFFTPYRLVPFGIGNFKNSVAGVLYDPLANLDVNPAYIYGDSVQASYVYLDFRSAREIRESRDIYFPYPLIGFRTLDVSRIAPYSRFYLDTRRELEPVISAAYLLRPIEGPLSNLSLGVTYQMVSQDEKYYSIPQDIYKSVLGVDYRGFASPVAESIPIVDKYNGTDNIHQDGHFLSLFTGYAIDQDFQVGAKLGRVSFNREGSYGSQNLWESYYSMDNTSLWRNNEGRNQSYGHWELIGGASYALTPKHSLGVTLGHLWGDADQVLTRGDSSYYAYGPIGSTTQNWSYYDHSGNQRQTWKHDGSTSLRGVDLKAQVSNTQVFQLHYLYARQNTDITLAGAILDTSYGRSRYQYDTTVHNHTSYSRLLDRRNGTGTREGTTHRAVGSLQWDLSPRVKLSLGLQYERRTTETFTQETVLSDRHSRYSNTGSYSYSSFDSTSESKSLHWTFRTRLTQFTIPIFLTARMSDEIELIFGLNRSASDWQVDDVTLAIFNYRVQVNQQGIQRRENFGERYTQPQERVSDVRTTLLAGLTVAPSNLFNIRFLVVPNFVDTFEGSELQDLQLWIAVNLRP